MLIADTQSELTAVTRDEPIVVTYVCSSLHRVKANCCYTICPMKLQGHACCCYRVMPIGYLQDQGLLNTTASVNTVPGVNGDAQAAANFFGDMCAANNNTNGPVFPPGVNYTARWPELCQACSVRARTACSFTCAASVLSLLVSHPVTPCVVLHDHRAVPGLVA